MLILWCNRLVQRSVTASIGRQFLLPAAAAMAGNLHTEHLLPERDRSINVYLTRSVLLLQKKINQTGNQVTIFCTFTYMPYLLNSTHANFDI